MITVMGATGHIGKKIAQSLLASGERVRALGRSAEKLAALEGAEARIGDVHDAEFLTSAFRGADAVFALVPPAVTAFDYLATQRQTAEAITKAIRESGVRYVVFLSSIGADLDAATGPIRVLHDAEQRLRALENTNVLFLRPVSFFENFETQLPLIAEQGIVADSVEASLAIPMVATRDIADAAARALVSRDFNGFAVRELLGSRELSYTEAAQILGARYVQVSYDDMAGALTQHGISESFARLYAEMTRAFNEGTINPRRTAENTTPTRFEDFARELARQ